MNVTIEKINTKHNYVAECRRFLSNGEYEIENHHLTDATYKEARDYVDAISKQWESVLLVSDEFK